MNTYKKLYLSLGLLISCNIIGIQESKENSIFHQSPENEQTKDEQPITDSIEKQIDQELYELFAQFFDDSDKTPFSKIITRVVNLLKKKKSTLDNMQVTKCDEIIKLLEKNKTNYSFPTWAQILINPSLLDLMSQETRHYIHHVSHQKKIMALIRRLKNLY